MNILIIIISLFWGVFIRPVFASEINIDSVITEGIPVGTTFPVVFEVVEANPDTLYYFKFFGGPEEGDQSIQTYNSDNHKFLTINDDWTEMPSFYTDSSGNAWVEGVSYIPSDKHYLTNSFNGIYFLFVRIADSVNQVGFSGYAQEIKVFPPLTTPIPPTSTPIQITPTKTPTPTPTLTLTPTPISHNQTSTIIPTPTINMGIFGVTTNSTIPVATVLDDLLNSIEDSNQTFIETGSNPMTTEEVITTKKYNLIPIIFVSLGGLFLIIPLVLVKIKIKPKCLKK